jgi:hypothetical protein
VESESESDASFSKNKIPASVGKMKEDNTSVTLWEGHRICQPGQMNDDKCPCHLFNVILKGE